MCYDILNRAIYEGGGADFSDAGGGHDSYLTFAALFGW